MSDDLGAALENGVPEPIDCPDCGAALEAVPTHCPECDFPLWAGVLAGAIQLLSDAEADLEQEGV